MTTRLPLLLLLFLILSHAGCAPRVNRLVGAVKDHRSHDILKAVREGDPGKLQALLDRNPALVNVKDSCGYTPLHWAAVDGRKEIMEILLKKGASPRALNNVGDAPLHCAAAAGRSEAAKILIIAGADMNGQNGKGERPLTIALDRGHDETAKILKAFGAQR
jgi:ankyrin repeat protein